MAIEIGPKHIAGIVIEYNLIKYIVVSNCIIYILYYILAYIQHKGMSHLKIMNSIHF